MEKDRIEFEVHNITYAFRITKVLNKKMVCFKIRKYFQTLVLTWGDTVRVKQYEYKTRNEYEFELLENNYRVSINGLNRFQSKRLIRFLKEHKFSVVTDIIYMENE